MPPSPATEGSRGLFITFEGGEGSGKSTQAALLAQRLRDEGQPVVQTFEPGDIPLGQVIWAAIAHGGIHPLTELFLFLADRAEHVAAAIMPALGRGDIVVCDRFVDSTLAYQGYGRALDLDTIRKFNQVAAHGIVPGLTVLLDIPAGQGLARQLGGTEGDALGQQPAEFHRRVREGYLELARREPQRFYVIDATLPVERVAELVWRRVQGLLASRW